MAVVVVVGTWAWSVSVMMPLSYPSSEYVPSNPTPQLPVSHRISCFQDPSRRQVLKQAIAASTKDRAHKRTKGFTYLSQIIYPAEEVPSLDSSLASASAAPAPPNASTPSQALRGNAAAFHPTCDEGSYHSPGALGLASTVLLCLP